ncbi:hypothetical protein TNCV_5081011 [Trichonephila clavipes]|nr:hypothetical protein TNCV_5081011 [Trichonephila clavipes]
MHEQEQEQEIEELESKDRVQSEDRMTVGNLTEGLSFIGKGGSSTPIGPDLLRMFPVSQSLVSNRPLILDSYDINISSAHIPN